MKRRNFLASLIACALAPFRPKRPQTNRIHFEEISYDLNLLSAREREYLIKHWNGSHGKAVGFRTRVTPADEG